MIQLSSDSCRESLFQEDWSQIDDVEGMEVHKDKKEETKEIPKRLHYCFQPSYAFFSLGPWNLCLLKTLEQFPLLVCFCLGLLFLFERGTHSSIFIQLPKIGISGWRVNVTDFSLLPQKQIPIYYLLLLLLFICVSLKYYMIFLSLIFLLNYWP